MHARSPGRWRRQAGTALPLILAASLTGSAGFGGGRARLVHRVSRALTPAKGLLSTRVRTRPTRTVTCISNAGRLGMEAEELSWLHRNLPKASVCEADRDDTSLARDVAMGHRLWCASAEGQNRTGLTVAEVPTATTRRVGARVDDAQSRLLLANMGLVLTLAAQYRNKGVSLSDLVQEGSLGLLHAMHKFNPDRNVKFVTYAYYWVHQYLARAVANKGYTIRLPVYVHEARRRFLLAREALLAEGVREPTDEEVARRARLPRRRVELLQTVPSVVSLDSVLHATSVAGEGGGGYQGVVSRKSKSMSDVIADTQHLAPEEVAQERMFRAELDVVLARTLKPRDYEIVRLRYGLDDGRPKRVAEISRELSINAQAVRRAEKSALSKLRKSYNEATRPRPRLRAQLKYYQKRPTLQKLGE